MDTQYGIAVTNKFELFLNEDADPYDILAQHEEIKKKQDTKEKVKSGKNKSAKKNAAQTENKTKIIEPPIPKKEEKPVNQSNQQSRQSERPPRSARQNRDRDSTEFRERREFREPREPRDNDSERRPRRRDDNAPSEFRERPEGNTGGFNRQDSGGSRGGFSRGRGRGGPRGRGMSRGGGFGDRSERKRDFERHSGSDRTSGVKAMDKREGGGAHNWGTFKDDIEEQVKETPEETKDWSQAVEDAENQDPNESTESTEQPPEGDEGINKQMTLDEWKAMQGKERPKAAFNIRKAGEGVDNAQWSKGIVYRKKEEADSDEEEEEEEEYEEEDEHRKKDHLNIKITFNDSPRRGRGGRRPRTGRGGRGGGGRGDRRGGSRDSAPKFDDEVDFPSLVKTAA